MISLADTTLVIANDAQRASIYQNMWTQWDKARGVTPEQAIEYYEWVNALEPCREGRLTYWALVKRSDPEGADVLASTRTLRRQAKTLNKAEGKVSDVISYVITSVVAPVQHRRNGYASHLLSLLHYAISIPSTLPPFPSAWGAPPSSTVRPQDATFATLWSDVGADFYRRVQIGRGEGARDGWIVNFDQEVRWEVPPLPESADAPALPEAWRPLGSVTDIPHDLLESLTSRALANSTGMSASIIAYDPPSSPGILHWISRYKRWYPAQLPFKGEIHNVYINESTSPASLIVLVPSYTPDETPTLVVSYLGLPSSDAKLLESSYDLLTAQAQRYRCAKVEVWQVPEEVTEVWKARSDRKVQIVKRDEHLGAMVWYGEEPMENVQAIGGEYYTWA